MSNSGSLLIGDANGSSAGGLILLILMRLAPPAWPKQNGVFGRQSSRPEVPQQPT